MLVCLLVVASAHEMVKLLAVEKELAWVVALEVEWARL
jgi:hypothetical protein